MAKKTKSPPKAVASGKKKGAPAPPKPASAPEAALARPTNPVIKDSDDGKSPLPASGSSACVALPRGRPVTRRSTPPRRGPGSRARSAPGSARRDHSRAVRRRRRSRRRSPSSTTRRRRSGTLRKRLGQGLLRDRAGPRRGPAARELRREGRTAPRAVPRARDERPRQADVAQAHQDRRRLPEGVGARLRDGPLPSGRRSARSKARARCPSRASPRRRGSRPPLCR